MALNMKNYKGFNKTPYCSVHYPQVKPTMVTDTPEARRLAENTRLQSQVKYHEEFEKSKGKVTQVADDPETMRIMKAHKIISNVSYHGDIEKKKQMEQKRILVPNDSQVGNNSSNKLQHQQPQQNRPVNQQSYQPPPQQQQYQPPIQQAIQTQRVQQQPQYHIQQQFHHHQQPSQPQHQQVLRSTAVPASQSPIKIISGPTIRQQPPNYQQHMQMQQQQQQLRNNPSVMTANNYPHNQQQTNLRGPTSNDPNQNFNNSPQRSNQIPQTVVSSNHRPASASYNNSHGPQAAIHSSPQKVVHIGSEFDPSHHNNFAPSNVAASGYRVNPEPNFAYSYGPGAGVQQPQQMPQYHQQPQHQVIAGASGPSRPIHGPVGSFSVRAMYDYTAQDVDEVSFLDGDLIVACVPIDEGWMTGTVQRTGERGMLPANYVEPCQ